MAEDDVESGESVAVSLELAGEYDDVLSKLRTDARQDDPLSPLITDLDAILATVQRVDGGTRSVVADALPAEMAVEYDPEDVVTALKILERYDLVALEGNTWNATGGVGSVDGE